MTSKYMWLCLMIIIGCPTKGAPVPSDNLVDLAPFGQVRSWNDTGSDKFASGVEWDEPRDFSMVEIERTSAVGLGPSDLSLEYWVSSWPSKFSGGWTHTDTPWQGSWRKISAHIAQQANVLRFEFDPLTSQENLNADNWVGSLPSYRRALKLRLVGNKQDETKVKALHVYGHSHWNRKDVLIQSGCENKQPAELSFAAYNGRIEGVSQILGDLKTVLVSLAYTDHVPGSNDRTIVTVKGGQYSFGFSVDEVLLRQALYLRPLGIFIGDPRFGDFQTYLRSGLSRAGEDIISRTDRQPEQSLERARGEVPALSMTNRSGRHSLRYLPLGLPSVREKYGLDFNGNIFINKESAKAMKEDRARMEWSGEEVYFRLGTGTVPDFREREGSARQRMLEDHLPLASTMWENEGIEFNQETLVTTAGPLPEAWKARGDEATLLLLRLTLSNHGQEPHRAHLWYYTTPQEDLRFSNGLLEARSGSSQSYSLRTAFLVPSGSPTITDLPRGSKYQGRAVHWESTVKAGSQQEAFLAIPFRTAPADSWPAVPLLRSYDQQRDQIVQFWRQLLSGGMEINVPDSALNSFCKAVLQHILLTVQRDVRTGLDMCPCATYDYNMFANETAIQVRWLDMTGRFNDGWRCLQPIVESQGSKAFPGRFQDKSAIFHGVRLDPDHDYTHHGYNLNHGWILWTLAEHYLYTRDQQFLRAQLPRILKAANWITQERQATKQTADDGNRVWEYGLLPVGQLEDNEEYQYWYAVNAYAYRGLHAAARAVAEIDSSEGARLLKEANDYRSEIRAAALRSMAAAPVAPLRDGTYVPILPPRTSLHGRELGWIRNILYGPHAMVDCGVFDPNEDITTWILQDLEDNLVMAEDSFSVPDADWFSRGGITLQPNLVNTFVSYMDRGEPLQALRVFYNTFAVSFYPDIVAFTEWAPALGKSGGPFYKTSDESAFLTWLRLMLVRESGDDLVLASTAPRAWFMPAKTIQIRDAMTLLGQISYRIASETDQGLIRAQIELQGRKELKDLILTFRHPQKKRLQKVEVGGRPWKDFDAQAEWIRIPKTEGTTEITAYY